LLHDTDRNAALQTFQDLVATRRRTSWRYKALFEIVESHLQANRLDQAGLACRRIIQEKQGHEEAGEATFRLAELHFLSGKPDSAQHLLDGLLAGSRTRYVLNDALALSMLIQDGSGENNNLLKTFGNAQKLQRQHQFQQALTVCDSLNQHHPESPLIDRIQDARAHLLDALGRYPEAIQACRQLIATTPWSPLCPNAQMRLAHIYENRLGQYHDAKKAYQTLLVIYPESLEADQARERLRQIQKKIQDLDEKKTG
jgi:tetratricopeptide (TPR) repeat protein